MIDKIYQEYLDAEQEYKLNFQLWLKTKYPEYQILQKTLAQKARDLKLKLDEALDNGGKAYILPSGKLLVAIHNHNESDDIAIDELEVINPQSQ